MSRIPIFMEDARYTQITSRIRETYPDACILFIDEIFNPKLQAEYDSFKLNAGATLEEVAVFHGTHANLIDKIADEGFDPNKNKVSAYGHGTYFAKNASYSFNYMKSQDTKGISYMFLADVIVTDKVHSVLAGTIYVSPFSNDCFS